MFLFLTTRASAASTAVYGHPTDQASASAASAYTNVAASASSAYNAAASGASSVSAQAAYASAKVAKKLDESKDYVFSSWDDNQLRTWLEQNNVISTPAPTGRAALLSNVKAAYGKATSPIYEAWSTSTIHEWLVEHGIVHPEPTAREKLLEQMKSNYWDVKDTAYSTWDESTMRDWLISEGVITNDAAQLKKEKYTKLLDENYTRAKSSAFSGWYDSEMRSWLVNHGYLKSDVEAKRDEVSSISPAEYTANLSSST